MGLWPAEMRARIFGPPARDNRRRQWHPTPVLLPGKSHGQRSLVGCSPWGRLSNVTFTFHFHALEKEMATHSSVPAWRIPGSEEPGRRPSMGSDRVGHDWSDLAAAAAAARDNGLGAQSPGAGSGFLLVLSLTLDKPSIPRVDLKFQFHINRPIQFQSRLLFPFPWSETKLNCGVFKLWFLKL